MFSISTEQGEKLQAWASGQEQPYTGAIGGRYTYCFTPTSLGVVLVVKDCVTKTEIDLTDYDNW